MSLLSPEHLLTVLLGIAYRGAIIILQLGGDIIILQRQRTSFLEFPEFFSSPINNYR